MSKTNITPSFPFLFPPSASLSPTFPKSMGKGEMVNPGGGGEKGLFLGIHYLVMTLVSYVFANEDSNFILLSSFIFFFFMLVFL